MWFWLGGVFLVRGWTPPRLMEHPQEPSETVVRSSLFLIYSVLFFVYMWFPPPKLFSYVIACVCRCWLGGVLLGLDGRPCVVIWRPEALDCRVPIPPEAWHWLTRSPPGLGFEPQTYCIWEPTLKPTELLAQLNFRTLLAKPPLAMPPFRCSGDMSSYSKGKSLIPFLIPKGNPLFQMEIADSIPYFKGISRIPKANVPYFKGISRISKEYPLSRKSIIPKVLPLLRMKPTTWVSSRPT